MIGFIASLICAIVTFGISLLQLSLALGAPLGEYVLGGSHKKLPMKMRLVCATLSLLFVIIGLAYLQLGNILHFGIAPMVVNIVVIINTLVVAYSIVGNGMLTKSKKEKYVMTPLSIIQFVSSVVAIFFTFR